MTTIKPKLYIRRQGTVLTIFVDGATNAPQPFYAWGEEPATAFPMMITPDELALLIRNYDPVYIDPPAKPAPLADHSDHSEEAQRQLDAAPKKEGTVTTLPKATPRPPTQVSDLGFDKPTIIAAFREIDEDDVEAVGSFLITLDAALEIDLMKARLPRAKKRFSLGGSNE